MTCRVDYDRDGNLTEIHDSGGDGSASYEYDALGRLVGATLSSGETITYRYDAIGRRYAVSTSAGTTLTLFDGWQEIGTVEPDGSSRAMLAVGEFRLAADTASGPMYVHAGLEGSVIALTNVLGELVERYRYTAFGLLKVLDAEGDEKDSPALSPWLYHGRIYEQSTGLYWMRMRHYSPDLGRFLQPDPAGIAGGINLYAYSNNNPLRFFDPWGLWPAPDASGGDDGKYGEADVSREGLPLPVKTSPNPALDKSEFERLIEFLKSQPNVVEKLRELWDETYGPTADGNEKGAWIGIDPIDGKAEVIINPNWDATPHSIYINPVDVPEYMRVIMKVHSHPNNGLPSHTPDYPAYCTPGSIHNSSWSMVMTQETSFFISPNQVEPGWHPYDNDQLF